MTSSYETRTQSQAIQMFLDNGYTHQGVVTGNDFFDNEMKVTMHEFVHTASGRSTMIPEHGIISASRSFEA